MHTSSRTGYLDYGANAKRYNWLAKEVRDRYGYTYSSYTTMATLIMATITMAFLLYFRWPKNEATDPSTP